MPHWPQGRAEIELMLRQGKLQEVQPSRDAADELIMQARKHAESASAIAESDPDGAHSLMYDAVRKTWAAILENQGLRATTSGGRVAVFDAVQAQLGPAVKPIITRAHRLRLARNRSEYKPLDGPRLEPADIDDDLPAVIESIGKAVEVLDLMPPF